MCSHERATRYPAEEFKEIDAASHELNDAVALNTGCARRARAGRLRLPFNSAVSNALQVDQQI